MQKEEVTEDSYLISQNVCKFTSEWCIVLMPEYQAMQVKNMLLLNEVTYHSTAIVHIVCVSMLMGTEINSSSYT